MISPGVGCGIVLLRGDNVLLLRRRRAPEAGTWSLVGGKVDFLERAEDAARRETFEEAGIVVGALSLLGVSEQLLTDEAQHWISLVFLADEFTGDPVLAEPEKHSDLGWFPLDALPSPLARAVPDAVRLLRARQVAGAI